MHSGARLRVDDLLAGSVWEWIVASSIAFDSPSEPNVVWITEVVDCLRKSFYARTRGREVAGFSEAMPIVSGASLHRVVEEAVQRFLGDRVSVEVPVEHYVPEADVTIRGRADVVVELDRRAVFEIKTTTRNGNDARPLPQHIMQLQFYLNALKVDTGAIVFVTPERIRVFPVARDPKVMESIEHRAAVLSYCLRKQKAPKREVRPYYCNACPYRFTCLGTRV
ncbi:MAG: hypothetical protein DRO39_07265 [Thermoprotei archaeon]|nr:MAG: hypothetical protein DRO39_07265 [Thermoprotei archaeon]